MIAAIQSQQSKKKCDQDNSEHLKLKTSPWPEEIRTLYLSGAANQFVLHGNVDDRLVLVGKDVKLGNLFDYLVQIQLQKFDLVFTYDLGHGLRSDPRTPEGEQALKSWPSAEKLPRSPRESIAHIDRFLRFRANLPNSAPLSTAVIIRTASLLIPARTTNYEVHSMATLLRSWSTETLFLSQNLATFLITENLNDLHPLVASNPRVAPVTIPLPSPGELETALKLLDSEFPNALSLFQKRKNLPAERLSGTTLSSVEALIKTRHHQNEPIDEKALTDLKKQLVERDCQGLIDFIEPDRTLDDIHGHEAVKTWMRQDIALWKQDDLKALPMGYLLSGPVGTGKTYLVTCLAGEAGVPVVKFKNFRDKWVGSTEGNLEKIFTLLHALGRCIVFIDEADQALGSRSAGSGDSGGVSGRVYSMMAKEMSQSDNRGKILWILASSRPDLIEIDLKRPGRIDVKLPLFPSIDETESYALIRTLCKRQGVKLPKSPTTDCAKLIPKHLTPGAAEAIAVKTYRATRTQDPSPSDALRTSLTDYQNPVPQAVMDFQIGLAIAESSDLSFVPSVFGALR